MDNKTAKQLTKQDSKTLWLAIGILLAVTAVFLLLVSALSAEKPQGRIAVAEQTVRGVEQVFVYDNNQLQRGDIVTWYVNGTKVDEQTYDGNQPQLKYTPQDNNTVAVKAKVQNKFVKSGYFTVANPTLQFVAPNVTMRYGETLPTLTAEFNCPVDCTCNCDCSCTIDTQSLDVGTYTIDFACRCTHEGYDTQYQTGTLTVLPCILQFADNLSKVYDGTTAIGNQFRFVNICDGDDLQVVGNLTYLNKNVGTQKLSTEQLSLQGNDAHNYVLPTEVTATISAKKVTLNDLQICDKNYDGTTKANICQMGNLIGVVSGDSVAIGNINVRFDNAQVGTHQIIVSDATLVGYDKANYVLDKITVNDAVIK